MATNKCNSCGQGLVDAGFSIFSCPNCGEYEIGRCRSCREHSTPYECEKCGFIGP
ncbi:MAG: zinc finger domain-containing protein [Candidatus Thermoplasmatota archaeon]|nr:zinc finger domain-containing protein [Candidatus Thermoplasmatota archaeon]MCL5665312.1 zinc finger domain-containing protein [Candidatus Thermoplasmatota archaeon]